MSRAKDDNKKRSSQIRNLFREKYQAVANTVSTSLALGMAMAGCSGSGTNWLGQSTSQPYQIASSSMAPGLVGPSLEVVCSYCGRQTRVAAETSKPGLGLRCTTCGGDCEVQAAIVPGQVTMVTAWDATKPLRRFERIVFRDPRDPKRTHVKRIWGLPGEQVGFRNGDLSIDGRLFQKNMQQLQSVALPVVGGPVQHPNHMTKGGAWRWQARVPTRQPTAELPPDQWLIPSSILDDFECNQGVSRMLHTVDDFLVTIDFDGELADRLDIRLTCSQGIIELRATPHVAATNVLGTSIFEVPCRSRIEVALCDGRLLMDSDRLDGPQAISLSEHLYKETAGANREKDSEERIGDESGQETNGTQLTLHAVEHAVQLKRVEVRRDQFLARSDLDYELVDFGTVPDDSYFVLGDNLPVSIDSRHELGYVSRSQIIGVIEAEVPRP